MGDENMSLENSSFHHKKVWPIFVLNTYENESHANDEIEKTGFNLNCSKCFFTTKASLKYFSKNVEILKI